MRARRVMAMARRFPRPPLEPSRLQPLRLRRQQCSNSQQELLEEERLVTLALASCNRSRPNPRLPRCRGLPGRRRREATPRARLAGWGFPPNESGVKQSAMSSKRSESCRTGSVEIDEALRQLPDAQRQVEQALRELPNHRREVEEALRQLPQDRREVEDALRQLPEARHSSKSSCDSAPDQHDVIGEHCAPCRTRSEG